MKRLILTVLKTGGEFTEEHVRELQRALAASELGDWQFACMTDLVAPWDEWGVTAFPLRHGWPGWWSKIELFRWESFTPRVLYLDLDTRIVGPLRDIGAAALSGRFTMLSDFYRPQDAASGLMAWRGGELRAIYARFREDPTRWMREFAEGDQGFIKDCIANGYVPAPARWQDELPGQVISYKCHVQGREALPENARVVCFHGRPRPWEVTLPPLKQREAA